MRLHSRLIGPLVCGAAAVTLLVMVLVFNAEVREVALTTTVTLLGIVTSPFVLESTTVAIMLLAVLAYNRWKRDKDGEDWVYLVTHETDDPTVSPSITQRLKSTVLTEKPQPLSEIDAATSVLEGYLELGMPSQAFAELSKLPEKDADFIPLRIRIMGANLQTEEAVELLQQAAMTAPTVSPNLVHAAIENARWLLQHLQRRDLAARWLKEANQLHPVKLAADDPLHALMPEPA